MSRDAPAETKLASIPVGPGKEAAIWRDAEGRTRWTAGVHIWATQFGSPCAPVLAPVDDGTLVAGEMLAGAEIVEIVGPVETRDIVVAGGRYLALVSTGATREEVFVLMRDEAGAIVPWPVDEELKRTRLPDADAQCPACGLRSWDVVERRAEPDASRYRLRAVVCATCGWYDGGWAEAGRRRRPEPELDTDFPTSPVSEDSWPAGVVQAASFPVYGVADARRGRRTVRQYGYVEDQVSSVAVGYECRNSGQKVEIQVTSSQPEHQGRTDADRARQALRAALDRDVWREVVKENRSIEATELRRQELMRPVLARLERTPVDRAAMRVAGAPIEFSVVRDDALAAAATEIEGVNVVVVCRGQDVEAVELTQITHPDDYFGPERGHTG